MVTLVLPRGHIEHRKKFLKDLMIIKKWPKSKELLPREREKIHFKIV